MSIESVRLFNHLVLCCPLLLLPSIFPSIRVGSFPMSQLFTSSGHQVAFNLSHHQGLSSKSARHISWPKDWSFSFSISLSSGYSGLISFRIDWFDLLAVQGTLKSLLQHHSLKASIFWCSAFLMVQLPHLYMTTEKIIALPIWSLVSKVRIYS